MIRLLPFAGTGRTGGTAGGGLAAQTCKREEYDAQVYDDDGSGSHFDDGVAVGRGARRRKRRSSALVDIRRRGGGAGRPEEGPGTQGHFLDRHAGRRRWRHRGHDRAARPRHRRATPPTAVQMLGFDILDWAKEGSLGNLDDSRRQGRLGQGRPDGPAAVLQI